MTLFSVYMCHIIDFCNAGLSLFCTGGALKRMFEWFYSWLPRTEDYRWRHWTRILSSNWWVDRSLLHDDDDDNDDNDDDDDDDDNADSDDNDNNDNTDNDNDNDNDDDRRIIAEGTDPAFYPQTDGLIVPLLFWWWWWWRWW